MKRLGEALEEKFADECTEIRKAARAVGDLFERAIAMPDPPPVVLAFCVDEPDSEDDCVTIFVKGGVKMLVMPSFDFAYRHLSGSPNVAEKLRYIESTQPQAAYILSANEDSTDYVLGALSIWRRSALN